MTVTTAPTTRVALDAHADLVDAVIRDRALRAAVRTRLEANEKAVKAILTAAGADTGTIAGDDVLTFTVGPDTMTLDVDALVASLPEGYADRFMTKPRKGRSELRIAKRAESVMDRVRAIFA